MSLPKEDTIFPQDLLNPERNSTSTSLNLANPPLDNHSFDAEREKWWVVFTKSRQEKAFSRDLTQLEIGHFLPLVGRQRLSRGRRVTSFVPIFPGYVFLFANEADRSRSFSTNRVSSILPVVDQSRLFDDLRSLRQLIQTDAPLTVERRLEPGQRVRIRLGPMQGLEGIIHARRGKTRLMVGVSFLQSGVSLEIDDFMVEPA